MQVCIIYKEDYPWDVRVEKLAKAILDDGHHVTIVCRNLDQKKVRDHIDGVDIRRLPRTNRWPGVVRKLVNVPLWFNPFWIRTILTASPSNGQSIYIVRDLPLVLTAVVLSWFSRNKVVFDMAECYPEMYASSIQFSEKAKLSHLFKHPGTARVYERVCVRLADKILVMIDESRDRLLKLGVPTSKISIVSNTPPTEKFGGKVVSHEGEALRLVYVGFLTRLRGLDILVRAVRLFLDKTEKADIRLDIVGKGAAREELIALVEELQLSEYVTIHGWLHQEEVDKLLDQANVGALTYRVCGHWNHTIPNKIFDYMLAGLPVLTTTVVPISRIVEATDCGLVCRDQDPDNIASALVKLRDSSMRARLGSNGNHAVAKHYNWGYDKATLNSCVSELAAQ